MGAAILWNSLVLKSTNTELFYITSSIPIPKKHFLASNTDPKIAEDKQHFRTKKNPHIYL